MFSFNLGGAGWKRIALLSAVAAAAIVPLAASSSQAAFTDPACGGAAISGNGSTLQGVAQTFWSTNVFPVLNCPGGPAVTYNANGNATGSGAGRNAMGAADGVRVGGTGCSGNPCNAGGSRFSGSDEPPTPTEQAHMNNGPTSATTDDAVIHVIPVAAAAITVVVHIPGSCTQPLPAGDLDSTGRIILTNAQLIGIFSHASGFRTWGDVLPGVAGCDTQVIHRVVRLDSSGSTFALKSFLNHAGGTFDVANNTAWPDDDTGTPGTCASTQTICRSASTGGGNLRTELNSLGTEGGIGYLALPDARSGYDFDPTATAPHDTTYWIKVQAVGTSTFFDPDANANGYRTTTDADASTPPAGSGAKGSNCQTTTFGNIPAGADPTIGDWSQVDGTGSTTGYPICTLTYDLAYDDDAAAYGNTQTEQDKARTVKDYLTGVVGAGQGGLFANDYDPVNNAALPGRPGVSLLSIAQGGVNAIGWNKAADQNNTPTTTTVATTQPTTTSTPTQTQPPGPPSNKFTVTSSHVSGHKLVVSIQLPGAGRLSVKATASYKGKTLTVGSTSKSVGGGRGSVTLNASASTLSALKKLKSLRVTVKITFTPTGGSAASKSVTLTLKGSAKPKHKSKHHR